MNENATLYLGFYAFDGQLIDSREYPSSPSPQSPFIHVVADVLPKSVTVERKMTSYKSELEDGTEWIVEREVVTVNGIEAVNGEYRI